MTIVIGYDPVTLREQVDLPALEARLAEIGEGRSRAILNEKVDLLRLAERYDDAWDVANEAVRQARFSGDREELTLARIRRAAVQPLLGKAEAAVVELTDAVTEASAHDWFATQAFGLYHRGRASFEQQERDAALRDFKESLAILVRIKAAPDEIDSSMIAITIVETAIDGGSR